MVHGDLKPSNILLKERGKTGIKLIDFGGARSAEFGIDRTITTIGYTAPEVLLNLGSCGATDMWSFGCVLFELKYGRHLFSGRTEREELASFMEVLGPVPRTMVDASPIKESYFDSEKDFQPR